MSWVLTIRTVAIDRLIVMAIENGVDTVINLGAGLDTRPYRMKLPSLLRWIEVDFPHMIDYLSSEDAAALSRDLFAIPTVQYWIQDYRQGGMK